MLPKSALTPLAAFWPPVVLTNERVDSDSGVLTARGVAKERVESDGGVKVARRVGLKRVYPKTGVALRPKQTPPETSEKMSAATRMEKNETVLVEWRNI